MCILFVLSIGDSTKIACLDFGCRYSSTEPVAFTLKHIVAIPCVLIQMVLFECTLVHPGSMLMPTWNCALHCLNVSWICCCACRISIHCLRRKQILRSVEEFKFIHLQLYAKHEKHELIVSSQAHMAGSARKDVFMPTHPLPHPPKPGRNGRNPSRSGPGSLARGLHWGGGVGVQNFQISQIPDQCGYRVLGTFLQVFYVQQFINAFTVL